MQQYKPPVGVTIKFGKDGFSVGKFEKGLWARWFKLDIFLSRWMRPCGSPFPSKTPIRDANWDKEFDSELIRRLNSKNPAGLPRAEVYDYKYAKNNPWKGKFWFVFDTRIRIPSVFISLFGRFYCGIKTYSVETTLPENYDARHNPAGDRTWVKDEVPEGRYGCPSATLWRSKRGDG